MIEALKAMKERLAGLPRHTRACSYGQSIGDEGDFCTCSMPRIRKDVELLIRAVEVMMGKLDSLVVRLPPRHDYTAEDIDRCTTELAQGTLAEVKAILDGKATQQATDGDGK